MIDKPRPRIFGVSPMLRTNDMPGTIAFYTQVLGFALCGAWPEDKPCWCDVRYNDVHVMFNTEDHHKGQPVKMTGRMYFYTDDVLGILERIKDNANVIEGPEVYFYGMKEIAILDNNGYTLAFGQDTDEPPTCTEH